MADDVFVSLLRRIVSYDLGRQWVATVGYQGSTTRHLTRQYNLNLVYAAQGIPLNPVVNGVDWYANDGERQLQRAARRDPASVQPARSS